MDEFIHKLKVQAIDLEQLCAAYDVKSLGISVEGGKLYMLIGNMVLTYDFSSPDKWDVTNL